MASKTLAIDIDLSGRSDIERKLLDFIRFVRI